METRTRSRIRLLLILASLAWVIGSFWFAFATLTEDDVPNAHSPAVKEMMQEKCDGSFSQRYACKEAIIIEIGRQTFYVLVIRLGIVVAGPILAVLFFTFGCKPEPKRIQRDDMAWKEKAAERTAIWPPPKRREFSD